METRIIDGRKVAEQIKAEVTEELQELSKKNLIPGLAAVLVGDDPASQLYVRNKTRTCRELGMHSETIELPGETTTEELLQVIDRLNQADEIDAILVQLPLPDHIDEDQILLAVRPDKDVDGFHPLNVRNLVTGKLGLAPCTPLGIMYLLKSEGIELKGLEAVVVGRSNIVGKPVSLMLQRRNATVTMCHSKTRNLREVCQQADILVAAVGVPRLVKADWIKAGAAVIDVGVSNIDGTLVGDVDTDGAMGIASIVTPHRRGVGPMTITMLLRNTLTAYRARTGE